MRHSAQAGTVEKDGVLYVFSFPGYNNNSVLKIKSCDYRNEDCRNPQSWGEFDYALNRVFPAQACPLPSGDDPCTPPSQCVAGYCRYPSRMDDPLTSVFIAKTVKALATSYRLYVAVPTNHGVAVLSCERDCHRMASDAEDSGFSHTVIHTDPLTAGEPFWPDGEGDQNGISSFDLAESTAGIYLAYNKGPQLFVSKCGKAYEADPDEPSLNCNRASGWSDAASIMGDVASFDAEGNATILSSKPEFKNDPAAELDLAAWDNMLVCPTQRITTPFGSQPATRAVLDVLMRVVGTAPS